MIHFVHNQDAPDLFARSLRCPTLNCYWAVADWYCFRYATHTSPDSKSPNPAKRLIPLSKLLAIRAAPKSIAQMPLPTVPDALALKVLIPACMKKTPQPPKPSASISSNAFSFPAPRTPIRSPPPRSISPYKTQTKHANFTGIGALALCSLLMYRITPCCHRSHIFYAETLNIGQDLSIRRNTLFFQRRVVFYAVNTTAALQC
jgi:hypothetical protein